MVIKRGLKNERLPEIERMHAIAIYFYKIKTQNLRKLPHPISLKIIFLIFSCHFYRYAIADFILAVIPEFRGF